MCCVTLTPTLKVSQDLSYSTHLHCIKWFLSITSICELKSLTPFHTRETVVQEAHICSISRLPNVREMGMDFETTQCYSVQPAGFACIALHCMAVSLFHTSSVSKPPIFYSWIFHPSSILCCSQFKPLHASPLYIPFLTHVVLLSSRVQFSLLFPCPACIDTGPLFFLSTSTPPSPNLPFQDAKYKCIGKTLFCPTYPVFWHFCILHP